MSDKPIHPVAFRNYAWDVFDIDTGTLSGIEKYLEWLEELICDDEKLKEVKQNIKSQDANG